MQYLQCCNSIMIAEDEKENHKRDAQKSSSNENMACNGVLTPSPPLTAKVISQNW